jgi:hypothetical protein
MAKHCTYKGCQWGKAEDSKNCPYCRDTRKSSNLIRKLREQGKSAQVEAEQERRTQTYGCGKQQYNERCEAAAAANESLEEVEELTIVPRVVDVAAIVPRESGQVSTQDDVNGLMKDCLVSKNTEEHLEEFMEYMTYSNQQGTTACMMRIETTSRTQHA